MATVLLGGATDSRVGLGHGKIILKHPPMHHTDDSDLLGIDARAGNDGPAVERDKT